MARVKEIKAPVQAYVSRQFSRTKDGELQEGKVVEKAELLAVNKFVTEPARVSVDYGLTLNLGNYETVRIGVALTVPCYMEELEDAYKWAAAWAESKVRAEQVMIRKTLRENVERKFDAA